jgi:hypothetical protein
MRADAGRDTCAGFRHVAAGFQQVAAGFQQVAAGFQPAEQPRRCCMCRLETCTHVSGRPAEALRGRRFSTSGRRFSTCGTTAALLHVQVENLHPRFGQACRGVAWPQVFNKWPQVFNLRNNRGVAACAG